MFPHIDCGVAWPETARLLSLLECAGLECAVAAVFQGLAPGHVPIVLGALPERSTITHRAIRMVCKQTPTRSLLARPW